MHVLARTVAWQGHVLARTTNRYANICVPHMCLHSYGFNTVCFEGFMGSPGKSPGNKHDQVRHQKTVIERTRTCTRTSRTCTCIRTHHAERHVGTPMNIHASSYHPDNDKHDHGSDENVKKRSRDMSSHFRMWSATWFVEEAFMNGIRKLYTVLRPYCTVLLKPFLNPLGPLRYRLGS